MALSQHELDPGRNADPNGNIGEKYSCGGEDPLLEGAAVLFSQQGKRLQAVRLFGALDEQYQPGRLSLPLRAREEHEQALASARSALGEEAFAAAWQEGQAMSPEQACGLCHRGIRVEGAPNGTNSVLGRCAERTAKANVFQASVGSAVCAVGRPAAVIDIHVPRPTSQYLGGTGSRPGRVAFGLY